MLFCHKIHYISMINIFAEIVGSIYALFCEFLTHFPCIFPCDISSSTSLLEKFSTDICQTWWIATCLNVICSGSACLPGLRLPACSPPRRGRRVHPGLLRVLRQPHLQVQHDIFRFSWDLFLPSFSDLMGLEHGVWAQAGLGTTPWSPAPTPSTGATIMPAEPSHFVLL